MALPYDELNATSEQLNTTADPDFSYSYTDMFAEELAYVLHVYLTPILIIVGVIGNLLSIIVFYKSKLRHLSASQYLSALAVSDTIFLLQLIPPWLKAVKASLVFVHPGLCQLFVYLTYVSSANSSWLVVAFTVERYVAVVWPLRSRACTARRARAVIACVGASCAVLNTPVLWLAQARGADCDIDRTLMEHAARFNVFDTVVTFTLPLTITAVLNVLIVVGVCRGGLTRTRLTREARASPHPHALARLSRKHRTRSQVQLSQQRVTRMLLLVSSVFVILNLPAYSMRIVAYAMNMSSYEYSGRWAVLQQICQLFFNANFGINFFLYCLSGQNFRNALLQTLPCILTALDMLSKMCGCGKEEAPPSPTETITPPASAVLPTQDSSTGSDEPEAHATPDDNNDEDTGSDESVFYATTYEHNDEGEPCLRRWYFASLREKRRFEEVHSACLHLNQQAGPSTSRPITYPSDRARLALHRGSPPLDLAPSPPPSVYLDRVAPAPPPIQEIPDNFGEYIVEDERQPNLPYSSDEYNSLRTIAMQRARAYESQEMDAPMPARCSSQPALGGRLPQCPRAARIASVQRYSTM